MFTKEENSKGEIENWGCKEYDKEIIRLLRSLTDFQLVELSKLIGISCEDLKEMLN